MKLKSYGITLLIGLVLAVMLVVPAGAEASERVNVKDVEENPDALAFMAQTAALKGDKAHVSVVATGTLQQYAALTKYIESVVKELNSGVNGVAIDYFANEVAYQEGNIAANYRTPYVSSGSASVNWQEVSGKTRYDTGSAFSKANFQSADTVLLVNGHAIADGLTASPLASLKKAPILLTAKDKLPASTVTEMNRLKPKEIIIIGGTGVISETTATSLKSLSFKPKVIRVSGKSRYDTAMAIAEEVAKLTDVNEVYVAYGFGEPDAMSIAPIAASRQQPIILSPQKELRDDVKSYLNGEGITSAIIVGGSGVVSSGIEQELKGSIKSVNRLHGESRYDTNAKVLAAYGKSYKKLYVAKGESKVLSDALAASPVAGANDSMLLLASSRGMKESQIQVLHKLNPSSYLQVGGGLSAKAKESILSAN